MLVVSLSFRIGSRVIEFGRVSKKKRGYLDRIGSRFLTW